MFWAVIALVILAPLPLGAVEPWAWSLLATVVGILLFAWCGQRVLSNAPPAVNSREIWPIVLFFGLASAWAAVQMLPVVPDAWKHPLWQDAARALGSDLGGSVSIDPYETGSALTRLLTYGGTFWLALQYGRDRKRASQAFCALTIAGLGYAAYGLAVEFTGARTVLWYPKTNYVDDVTSTFVNRNSYATYAGLGLVCTTGLLIQLVHETYGGDGNRRERLRLFLARLTERGWILLVSWVTIATALLLTGSRGGFLSACLALVTLFAAAGAARSVRRRHAVAMTVAALAAGAIFFAVSGQTVSERLAKTSIDREERARVYELTAEAIADGAWLGAGYGTFPEVFRIYRDETIPGIYEMAHNTYLENLLELGVPAATALFLAVATAGGYCALGVRRRRRDMVYPAVGLAATVLVAAHSLADFSLQIPAVAVTYAFLLGVGCAQSQSTRQQSRHAM